MEAVGLLSFVIVLSLSKDLQISLESLFYYCMINNTGIINIIIVKLMFPSIFGLILLLISSVAAQQNQNTTTPQIYGVRWFLGQHFAYSINTEDTNEHFILMFNSDTELRGELNVEIANSRFTCSTVYMNTSALTIHHPQENITAQNDDVVDEAYISECFVGDIKKLTNNITIRQIGYRITLANLYITQTINPEVNGYTTVELFKGEFRLPYYNNIFQSIVIGDWGKLTKVAEDKGYAHVLPCLVSKINENKDIVFAIFTGDLAYDLQGPKYYAMLKHIQVITSKIVFQVTPGNHDTLYHADTFELYTKTFKTPQWRKYFNYFNLIKLDRIVLLSYTPELQAYDFNKTDRIHKNLTDIFKSELTNQVIQSINNSYFPIAFSHYPIYCSNIYDDLQSCSKNMKRFSTYRQFFNKISMKVYLSGHLHLYERTKPICYNGSFPKVNTNKYDLTCPVYIVQGAGGSDRYLQMKQDFPLKNYSAALAYNTGFGIMKITFDNYRTVPSNFSYEHISCVNCSTVDSFVMVNTELKGSNIDTNDSNPRRVEKLILKTAIISLGIGIFIILSIFIHRKYKRRISITTKQIINQNNNQHIEMVQQHFEAPQSDKNSQKFT